MFTSTNKSGMAKGAVQPKIKSINVFIQIVVEKIYMYVMCLAGI